MPLTEYQGDLFTSQARSLGHGVNTVGKMGAGIAVEFKRRFPDMYDAYHTYCLEGLLAPGEIFPYYIADQDLWIYNIASQDEPGAHATMPWMIKGTINAVLHASIHKVPSLAIPRIGCGIGGLSWTEVHKAITLIATTSRVEIELWSL